MKKVEKVSIAEISFTLDSDAYSSLKQYLDSLHEYYANDPDGREIIADIEARIAELILEEQIYTKVVSRPLIDTIIAQLGTPDQIDGEAGEGSGSQAKASSGAGTSFSGAGSGSSPEPSIPRRLHRSTEGKIFGGVCSGLATFLDISVAWVRLVFLIPALFFFVSLPVHWHWLREFSGGWGWVFFVTYIVLWIALPMARTPRQKLEARGEKITPSSIRHNLQGAVNTPTGRKAASVAAELLTVLGRVVLFFVKFVMAVIGFSLMFAAMIVFMVMLSSLFAADSMLVFDNIPFVELFAGMTVLTPALFVTLALLCAFLPLTVIGMALLGFTFSWRLGRTFFGVMLGSWAVAIILFGIVCMSNARFFHDQIPHRIENWNGHWDDGDRHHNGRGVRIEIRDTPAEADGLGTDAIDDSVIMSGKPENEALPTDATTIPDDGEATDEVEDSNRIKINRIEE